MKWTIEMARELFNSRGLFLDEERYINNTTKMKCHDSDGYKYLCTLADLRSGRTPYKFIKSNPYTLDNINMFFKNNGSETKVISTSYTESKEILKFQCECNKEFESKLNNIVSDKKLYCNYCSKSKRYNGLRDYTKLVSDECEQKGYRLITPYIHRSDSKFEYICKKHQEKGIQVSYYDRMVNREQGCKYCGIESRGIKHRTDEDIFIKTAEEKGFEYIDCDYPRRKCGFTKARLHLICKKHVDKGVQYFTYDNLVRNISGCRYCAGYDRSKKDLQEQINELGLDITILEYNSYTDLRCRCNQCGCEWNNKGVNLTQGHGCPICKKSKGEIAIQKCLTKWDIEYVPQKTFDNCRDIGLLPFDFYLPQHNTLIEYDGIQHYKPIDFDGKGYEDAYKKFQNTKKHDNIKSNFCLDNNINLIRIPYWEFENNNLEQYLNKYIKND